MFSPYRFVALITVGAMSLISCNREAASSSGMMSPARVGGSAPPLRNRDIAAQGPVGEDTASVAYRAARFRETMVPPQLTRGVVPVAIVRSNGFTHAGDSAVLLRRHTAWPYNVIVMDDEHLSVPILGAAMTALSHEVKASGEVPATDYTIPVRAAAIPKSWNSGEAPTLLLYLARWELDTLKRIPLSNVQGIGDVPAILVHLGTAKP